MRVKLSLTYVFLFHSTSFRNTKDPGHGRKGSLYDAIQARKASDFLPFPHFSLESPVRHYRGLLFQAAREGKKLCSRMGVGESLEVTCSWGWPVNCGRVWLAVNASGL